MIGALQTPRQEGDEAPSPYTPQLETLAGHAGNFQVMPVLLHSSRTKLTTSTSASCLAGCNACHAYAGLSIDAVPYVMT